MSVPPARFRPRKIDELGLRLPTALTGPRPAAPLQRTPPRPAPAPPAIVAPMVVSANGVDPVNLAVEIDRVVPPSGNLGVCGHQFWFGPSLGG